MSPEHATPHRARDGSRVQETGRGSSTTTQRGASRRGVVWIAWAVAAIAGAAGTLATLPDCAFSAELAASMARPATILAWVMLFTASFGSTGLIAHLLGRPHRGGAPRTILVCVLAAGCGASAIVIPAGVLGFAISEHSPSCALGPTPVALVVFFLAGALLLVAALVWLVVAFLARAFHSPASL